MKVRGALLILVCSAIPTAADAAWMARCVNDGICEAYVCVPSPQAARQYCKRECGNYAVVTNLSDSNCTPENSTMFQWKAPDYDEVIKTQEADKAPVRELGDQ